MGGAAPSPTDRTDRSAGIDDGADVDPTYATGSSPILYYRNPFIADIQTPVSETALDALSSSPLQDKQTGVNKSRYGATGRLVITSIFACCASSNQWLLSISLKVGSSPSKVSRKRSPPSVERSTRLSEIVSTVRSDEYAGDTETSTITSCGV